MTGLADTRGGGYRSVRDVWLRCGLDLGQMEKLAEADAFRSIGLDRRAALWQVRALDKANAAEHLPLFERPALALRDHEPAMQLPLMPPGEHVIHDYRSLGLSLKAHPVSFLRQRLDRAGITPNASLPNVPDGRRVSVAGLVLVRQRPGKGNAIFLTLEDEGGIANIIVWQRNFERFRPIIMGGRFIRVGGKLQSESGVIHIVADRMEDISSWLGALCEGAQNVAAWSRDGVGGGGGPDSKERPRESEKLYAAMAEGGGETEKLSRNANEVMPKGRNFH
jgi:error-prone DNA polymerase